MHRLVVRVDRLAKPTEVGLDVGVGHRCGRLELLESVGEGVSGVLRDLPGLAERRDRFFALFEESDGLACGFERLAGGGEVALGEPPFVDRLVCGRERVGRERVCVHGHRVGEPSLELEVRAEVAGADRVLCVPVEHPVGLAIRVCGGLNARLADRLDLVVDRTQLVVPLAEHRGRLAGLPNLLGVPPYRRLRCARRAVHVGHQYTSSGSKTRSPTVSPSTVR